MTDTTGMDRIKAKIEETLASLQQKRDILERHKSQYNDFKFKLYDLELHGESDAPEIPVYINSKGRVKGHMVHPKKILVFLGCEYFVERDPKNAVNQVENKLKVLKKAIQEFDLKIKEARKTLDNIGHLESLESQQKKKIEELPNDEPPVEMNEESLPFMDIREELDEDGNVISSTLNPQDKKKLEDFGKEHAGVEIRNEEDELKELLRDMEITPKHAQKIEQLFDDKAEANNEEDDVEVKVKSDRTLINKKESSKSITVEEIPQKKTKKQEPGTRIKTDKTLINKTKKQETMIKVEEDSVEAPGVQEPVDGNDEYYKLMKEMGIVDIIPAHSPQPAERTVNKITNEDFNQLQEISNDLNFEEDEDDDDELDLELQEYDYEIGGDDNEEDYGDEDKEDNEDDDWDFTRSDDHIVPHSHRDLFMRELERIRKQKGQKTDKSAIDEVKVVQDQQAEPKKKKSVSFAPKLEIKEIENISEELKQPDRKVSKFKQARSGFNNSFSPVIPSNIVDKDVIKPLGNSADEGGKTLDMLKKEPVTLDIAEKETMVNDIVEENKQVTFDIVERESEPINSNIMEKEPAETHQVITDIVESSPQPSKRISKFKSSRYKQDKPLVHGDRIIEPAALEQLDPPTLKSSEHSKPTVIAPPSNDNSYEPVSQYESIKAYIENEDDDEDALLNDMADEIDVYIEGEDEDEDEWEIDESRFDGEYGPVLLDEIIENDEVDDPDYFVDDGFLEKEYKELRSRMISKYAPQEKKDRIIVKEEEGQELEPIDEHGNPIKVSRFRKSIGRA